MADGQPLSPGGQNFQRIAASRTPAIDLNPPHVPEAYSNPDEPLPVRATPMSDRIAIPPKPPEMYGQYGEPGPQQEALGTMQAANTANKGRGATVHTGGVWDRIKDALIVGARGLKYGPMGGLGGFTRGIFDPQYKHEQDYELRDLPRAEKAAVLEAKQQDETMNRIGKVAQITGQAPSGAPTETARERMARESETAAYHAQTAANQQGQRSEANDRINDRRIQEWDRYHPGEPYPEEIAAERPYLRGKNAPKKAAGGGQAPHTSEFRDAQGNRVTGVWDPETESYAPARTSGGMINSRTDEAAVNADLAKKRYGEEVRQHDEERRKGVLGKGGLRDQFEEIKRQTTNLEREAREMTGAVGKGGASYGKGHPQEGKPIPNAGIYKGKIITKADAEAKYGERDAAKAKMNGLADTLESEHGDLVEVGGKDRDSVRVRRGSGPAQGKSSQPANQSVSAAVERYKDYVGRHPEMKERARQQFMKQNPGVDPEQ